MGGNSGKTKIRQAFSYAACSYDSMAWLQRQVGLQLLSYADPGRITGRVLDLGSGTGFLTGELLKRSPSQAVIALDLALPMLLTARGKLDHHGINYVCADAENLPFAEASLDMICSNLALQWCNRLDKALSDCHRTLKPGGKLLFSTFGAGTLQELRNAWAAVDSHQHVNEFYQEQQLIQLLQEAGFTDIQLHRQSYRPNYPNVLALLKELKGLGARTVVAGRSQHLTGKQKMHTMMEAYQHQCSGQITASFHTIMITARR